MTIQLNYSVLQLSFRFIFVLGWLFICIKLLHLQFSFTVDFMTKQPALSIKSKLIIIIIIVLLYKDQITLVQTDLFIRSAQFTDDKELR